MPELPIPAEAIRAAVIALHGEYDPEATGWIKDAEAALRAGLEALGCTVEEGFIDGEHPVQRDPAYRLSSRWLPVGQDGER